MHRVFIGLNKLSPRTLLVSFSFFSVLLFSALPQADDQPQSTLPKVELSSKEVTLLVELATSSRQRFMGLSFRRNLDDNAGMLFVYPSEKPLTFTMRNTLIPLSIAYLSENLVVNEIHDMNVGPGQLFPSARPAMYALEVNQGWFEANGIEPGAMFELKNY